MASFEGKAFELGTNYLLHQDHHNNHHHTQTTTTTTTTKKRYNIFSSFVSHVPFSSRLQLEGIPGTQIKSSRMLSAALCQFQSQ
jgi:hypothetical protein